MVRKTNLQLTETLLDKCRKFETTVTNRVVEVCLRSVDALKHMVANLLAIADANAPNDTSVEPVFYGDIREEMIESFMKEDSQKDIFLLSTR